MKIKNNTLDLRAHTILIARIIDQDTNNLISKLYFTDLAGSGILCYVFREIRKRTR